MLGILIIRCFKNRSKIVVLDETAHFFLIFLLKSPILLISNDDYTFGETPLV